MQPTNLLDVLGPAEPSEPRGQTSGALGRDEFLRMLIAQLENQDPLNPQEATEFSAQLAQFSTLEQLISIRSAIEAMARPNAMTRVLTAAGLIGREVLVEGQRFSVDASGSVEALEFELPQRATSVQVIVTNSEGAAVRVLDLGRLEAGRHRLDPVLQDNSGNALPEGLYEFHVNAKAGATILETKPFVRAHVTGAAPSDDGTAVNVLLGGLSVPLSKLLEVRAAEARP